MGLIRASSNKPSLVVVTESPNSEEENYFDFIDNLLQETGKIGSRSKDLKIKIFVQNFCSMNIKNIQNILSFFINSMARFCS